jgi:hypothetical protein
MKEWGVLHIPLSAGAKVNPSQGFASPDGCLDQHRRIFVWIWAVQGGAPRTSDGHRLFGLATNTHQEVDEPSRVHVPISLLIVLKRFIELLVDVCNYFISAKHSFTFLAHFSLSRELDWKLIILRC